MFFARALTEKDGLEALGVEVQDELIHHKIKYIFRGVVFIVAGLLAMILSAWTPIRAEHLVGILVSLLGIAKLFWTLRSKPDLEAFLTSLLFIVVGTVVLKQPQPLLLYFLTALAVLMTIEGLLEMFLAFRKHPVKSWGWILFVAFITLTGASAVWISFPLFFDAIAICRIIAMNAVFYGLLLLMLVWQTEY